MGLKWIVNVRIVMEAGMIECGSVCIDNGRIASVKESIQMNTEDVEVLDGKGRLLILGMIDVHIHGQKATTLWTVRSKV